MDDISIYKSTITQECMSVCSSRLAILILGWVKLNVMGRSNVFRTNRFQRFLSFLYQVNVINFFCTDFNTPLRSCGHTSVKNILNFERKHFKTLTYTFLGECVQVSLPTIGIEKS